MEFCRLSHIPDRLHTNDRPTLPKFYLQENIYRRAKPDDVDNPFKSIPSLRDISVNRQGAPQDPISEIDDVLLNTLDSTFEKYMDQGVTVLTIKELTIDQVYEKMSAVTSSGRNFSVKLVHDPDPCNYAHCAFKFWCDGEEVTKENYDDTLGRDKKARGFFRLELAKMIERREIRVNPSA